MKTVREVLDLSSQFLETKGVSNPRRMCEEVLAHVLDIRRLDLYMDIDRPLQVGEVDQCRRSLKRLAGREPYQYVVGEVEFCECKIQVSPAVLIPRQETEILVHQVIERLEKENLEGKVLWDLCTGSGCIAIALKKCFPELKVVASDMSEEALAQAKKNASTNSVDVEFLKGDFLTPFEGKQADYILSNPPYISEKEYLSLEPEVKEFEPKMALVADDEGLAFYRALAEGLPQCLKEGGKVWLEMGYQQGEAIKQLFSPVSGVTVSVQKDWSGHDRFFFLEFC